MKFIAHRGLMNGPDTVLENHPDQIDLAIEEGFDVEIDVWYINGKLLLGHDTPSYKINLNFLQRPAVWAHAKNLDALAYMLDNQVHCFWHENDQRTLTSQGWVWTYPNKQVCSKSVLVVLEKDLILPKEEFYGVCGDYVSTWS